MSEIISCAKTCKSITKLNTAEYARLYASMAHTVGTLYYCGYCNHGQNEWRLEEMLFDKKNELAVTPCCHTEATEALKCYCVEGYCEAENGDDGMQERQDYIYAQTGR